jgi:hypothetical protein
MERISEKLDIIKSSKDDIKTAIEAKGVTVGDIGISEYASKINEIEGNDPELTASYLSLIDGSLGANVTKLPNNLTEIGKYAFQQRSNLKITELPESVTTIRTYAFSGCTALTSFKLPKNLTLMEDYVFYSCSNLKITEIPEGVTILKAQVFRSCREMEELTVKGNITSIYTYVFYSCSKFKKLVLPNITNVPTLSNANAFEATPIKSGTGYIYVPDNLVDTFKTATNWSTFANQIKGLSELEG